MLVHYWLTFTGGDGNWPTGTGRRVYTHFRIVGDVVFYDEVAATSDPNEAWPFAIYPCTVAGKPWDNGHVNECGEWVWFVVCPD